MLAWHRLAVNRTRTQVCRCACRAPARADRCVRRAEGSRQAPFSPGRLPSLLAALTLQKVWLAFHILYGSSHPSLFVSLSFSCTDVWVHGREAFSCARHLLCESGIHSTNSDSRTTTFPSVLLVLLKRKFSCYLK